MRAFSRCRWRFDLRGASNIWGKTAIGLFAYCHVVGHAIADAVTH